MPGDLGARVVIRLAGRIVPPFERANWDSRWFQRLYNLGVLIARGEFPREHRVEVGWLCRAAIADAFRTRFVDFDFQRYIGAPGLMLAAVSTLLLAVAASTRGFFITRALLAADRDRFLPYVIIIAFALLVGVLIAIRGRAPLRGHNWRYWSFLLLKTAVLLVVLSIAWIEGGFALRRHLTNETVRALGGGLLLAVMYLAAVGSAVLWSLNDQQRRCPVCLRRMSAPVRIGSWASVFEPVATELLCDEGHGALCVQECEMGEPDHWVAIGII